MQINILTFTMSGMSGGVRIFIECARRWAKKGHGIRVFTAEEGYEVCKYYSLENVIYELISTSRYKRYGLAILYLARTVLGCLKVLETGSMQGNRTVIYSSSDFWPDSIPGLIMKWRNKKALWIAAFFLFAPNPFKGYRHSYEKGLKVPVLRELFYFITQRPMYWIILRYADMIFVTSEPDREKFIKAGRMPNEVVTIRGGVDIRPSTAFLSQTEMFLSERKYDACFVGRFHPQKGVIELIEIWAITCNHKPDAHLAMIGNGSLEDEMRKLIRVRGLEKNIDLLGFKDGEDKYEVFKSSKMILHPAVYDSGGMAACEGMAWGLPAVGFDLPALKTYYAKGMLKAPIGDIDAFAELIIKLLIDRDLYETIRAEAIDWANEWDWDKRAEEILNQIEIALISGNKLSRSK